MSKDGHLALQLLKVLDKDLQISYARGKRRRRDLHIEGDILWQSIDRKQLYAALDRLRLGGAVSVIQKGNRMESLRLTAKGRAKLYREHLKDIKLTRKKKWDKKWRMVMFDIPEERRRARDDLRMILKQLGFLEFQKSVFVFPDPCRAEINFIINTLDIDKYVFYVVSEISPDTALRKHFKV